MKYLFKILLFLLIGSFSSCSSFQNIPQHGINTNSLEYDEFRESFVFDKPLTITKIESPRLKSRLHLSDDEFSYVFSLLLFSAMLGATLYFPIESFLKNTYI